MRRLRPRMTRGYGRRRHFIDDDRDRDGNEVFREAPRLWLLRSIVSCWAGNSRGAADTRLQAHAETCQAEIAGDAPAAGRSSRRTGSVSIPVPSATTMVAEDHR